MTCLCGKSTFEQQPIKNERYTAFIFGLLAKVLAKSADETGLESKMLQFFYNILWQRRLNNITVYELSQYSIPLIDIGGLHLPLLVFPFVYQFNSRIGLLVCSSFANDQFKRISALFQNLFVVVFIQKRMQLLHLSLFLY